MHEPSRVTLDFLPMGVSICEVVLTHELADGEVARSNAKRTEQGWTRMLEQLDKVLTTRSWGITGVLPRPDR